MISIKHLYVIIPVLILLIGIIWSIIHISKKSSKTIKNTNTVFIPSKSTYTKKTNLKKTRSKGTTKKRAKTDKKRSKKAKKRSKKSKRKYTTE
jgi:ABC-type glycerol-3-phosphate transport system permease component